LRKWFNSKIMFSENREVDFALDKLFDLMKQGFLKYFNIKDASCFDEAVEIAKQGERTRGEKLFIEWIEEKGKLRIDEILKFDFPNEQHVIAGVEYDIYIMDAEVTGYLPDEAADMRGMLISLINHYLDNMESRQEEHKQSQTLNT
jgi:hypothetical protein